MTLFQIEAFLLLSNTLNYTKASTILHTTQPNLSKIISSLEQELGIQLFVRNKREVKLTPAGEAFGIEMQTMMKHYNCAISKAREVDAGIRGSIEVGFLGTALSSLMPQIVRRFHKNHPDIILKLYDYPYSRLVEAIIEEEVDIALFPVREPSRIPNLKKKFMFADAMCLVFDKNHSIADGKPIDLHAIRNEPFVVMDPNVSVWDYDLVKDICTENNFVPKIAYLANSLASVILMVECGVGVSILASHMIKYASDNISFVKINGYEDYFRMSCVWHKDANPCLPQLLNVFDECSRDCI